MFSFLKSMPVRVATVLLLAQSAVLYSSIREEFIPTSAPLSGLPRSLGSWQFLEEGVIDKETMDVLKADDTLNRMYTNGSVAANLFVAGFKSQRTGKAPHSPKNCLPGSGWTPLDDQIITLDAGGGKTVEANRYIIAHGESRSLVLYWYQSRDRSVASEYTAKFWVVADAMRYNRTDTALVRVVIPIVNKDEASADRQATDFVKSFYSSLLQHLPA